MNLIGWALGGVTCLQASSVCKGVIQQFCILYVVFLLWECSNKLPGLFIGIWVAHWDAPLETMLLYTTTLGTLSASLFQRMVRDEMWIHQVYFHVENDAMLTHSLQKSLFRKWWGFQFKFNSGWMDIIEISLHSHSLQLEIWDDELLGINMIKGSHRP